MPRLPQVSGERMVRVALRLGWVVDRQRGSHATLRHPDRPSLSLTIPRHRAPLKPAILISIMSTLGIDREELRGLL
ncbi:MAG: type II toxin-antitoxin system HicA family toxin [Dehalococcoidia bacterium]